MLATLRDATLSLDEAVTHVSRRGAGAIAVFLGVVRDRNDGREVTALEYEAYRAMAAKELLRIAEQVEATCDGVRVAALHRLGTLAVGDIAVVCAASAPHRGGAFTACRALIEGIKANVPIWKRERGPDGTSWVGWVDARCHDHAHAGAADLPPGDGRDER